MAQGVIGAIGLGIQLASAGVSAGLGVHSAVQQGKARKEQRELAIKAGARQEQIAKVGLARERQAEAQAERAAQAAAVRSRFGALSGQLKGGTIQTSPLGVVGVPQTTGKTLLGI